MMHYRGGRCGDRPRRVYPDIEAFWDDLGAAYADEIEALGKLGCTYLQIDDTSLAYLNDPNQRDYVHAHGGDGERPAPHLHQASSTRPWRKKPAGMTVCTHLCRGNFRSSWVAAGGYDYVAEALFNQLNVDGYFLEYDDARSGGFEPLRFVPKGKTVVLGLVTTKRAALESKDELKRRHRRGGEIRAARSALPFAAVRLLLDRRRQRAHLDEQEAKLRLVVEVANEVWGASRSRPTPAAYAGQKDDDFTGGC